MPAEARINRAYEGKAYWHATMPVLPARSGRSLPDAADAVVIGGGYTGVAAARKLALQGAKVVLLEANNLGFGASSRNGGICHPGFKWGPGTLVKKYGRELAIALYAETVQATDLLAGTIRDQGIDAELRYNGYMELAWARAHAEDFGAERDALAAFGTTSRVIRRDQLSTEIGT